MYPTIPGRRQPLPTILTVYRPIEDFRESTQDPGLGSRAFLEPLDAFLVHRLLDLVGDDPIVIDEAMVTTGGSTCLIGLNHPRVQGVWAVSDRGSTGSDAALSALRRHLGRRDAGATPPLEAAGRHDLATRSADWPAVVVLMHAEAEGASSLADGVAWWLDRRPDAWVLVLGLGKVGHCPAMTALVNLCTPESGRGFQLLRERNEVLIASRLGVVARRDDPGIALALDRLGATFSGNFRYLDLLRRVNDAAIREAQIDADTLRNHVTFWPLSQEIDALKRATWEAEQRAAAATLALQSATAPPVVDPLAVLRRKLSPTPVGQAYRLAKRVRRKLSPTPVGAAWRLAKRGLGAYAGRGGRGR